jgi:hypothetical protein
MAAAQHTGNVAINTPTNAGLTTTTSAAYLFNETATTVKIGGAGTTQTAALTATGQGLFQIGANINTTQTSGADFYVFGKTDTTLIWAHAAAAYDQVVIGNAATSATLVPGAKITVNSTDSILLPVGTQSQRPGGAFGGTATAGMFRYNSTAAAVEWYTGTQWVSAGTTFTVITDQQISADGVNATFGLSQSSATASAIVSINGVLQLPTVAYSISGSSITFTEIPQTGDVIDIRYITTTTTVANILSPNGLMGISTDNNGVYINTGSVNSSATTYWDTSGGQVGNIANVTVTSSGVPFPIDNFNTSTYRSAKYIVQISNSSAYTVSEALVIQNSTSATINVYANASIGGNLGILSANTLGSTAYLNFTATNSTGNIRVTKRYTPI